MSRDNFSGGVASSVLYDFSNQLPNPRMQPTGRRGAGSRSGGTLRERH